MSTMRTNTAFTGLRRLARPLPSIKRCDLCGAKLAPIHPHLFELQARELKCACVTCSRLFDHPGGKYRRVNQPVRLLADFILPDAQWERLLIPINLAFFYHDRGKKQVVAFYPSPAGAIESLLPLSSWEEIQQTNPILREMEPEVEALLVNRVGGIRVPGGPEYYLTPIDVCFRLVGVMRSQWEGLSGGTRLWQEVADFFSGLREQAEVVSGVEHA
ncbi:MAG: hypothetical protein K1Y36_28600 [Blastocatellia bacterium]|nr:hypothetical protein [Blastocatellia bacterium]